MTLVPLFAAWAIGVVSPGPDFIAVLRTSAARGRTAGRMVGVGVVSAIACWATLAMTGLALLLSRFAHLYLALRAIGALFLVGYGITILVSVWRARSGGHSSAAAEAPRSLAADWRLGFATNLANPKALLFFGALFASLLPPHLSGAAKAGVVLAMLAMALGWFTLVATVASSRAVVRRYERAQRGIDTVAGGVFATVGLALMPR